MPRFKILAATVILSAVAASSAEAVAPSMWATRYRAPTYNWNGNYAHVQYGQPVAVALPPTVRLQTNWGWGVGSSRILYFPATGDVSDVSSTTLTRKVA